MQKAHVEHGVGTDARLAARGSRDGRGGGVYVDGMFTMSSGEISGNSATCGGGMHVNGMFRVSGNPVVSGNTNLVGAAANVYLPNKKITVDSMTAGATIGVTTYTAPTEGSPVTITTGAAMLKVVDFGTTNVLFGESGYLGRIAQTMGYSGEYLPCRRIVLASDVAELWQRNDWDTPYEICNGYLVLRITGDLSLPKSEWQAISWFMEFEDGRAEIVIPESFMESTRSQLESDGGVSGLFLSVCIETKPALEFFENLDLLIAEP